MGSASLVTRLVLRFAYIFLLALPSRAGTVAVEGSMAARFVNGRLHLPCGAGCFVALPAMPGLDSV